MYNSNTPSKNDLPSAKKLLLSTCAALSMAVLLLITVILPAEYAIDPTGVGRAIGLMEMGEIKAQLEQEAIEDQKNQLIVKKEELPVQASSNSSSNADSTALPKATAIDWRDEIVISLEPTQGAEIKLVMSKGAEAMYSWVSQGGKVNYDTHGDGNGQSISYQKGRGVADDEGDLVAAFDGNHGWFFRNRTKSQVTVTLRTRGDYKELKRVL